MKNLPKILCWLSVLTAVLGGIVSVFQVDILGLAGTQWIMIAILLGVWSHGCKNCSYGAKKE